MSTTIRSPSTGRFVMGLGVLAAVAGLAIYATLLLGAHLLHTPWYMLGFSALALALVLTAMRRKRSVWRLLVLLVLALLTCFEAWILFSYSQNPAYAGPAAGVRFPTDFTASLADGKPFTGTDLIGRDTLLVFYRGHW